GQAVLGRQNILPTPWLTERHGYDPTGIMYRLDGALTPMACHRHTGRFVVKAGVSRETDHAFNQAKFTPKGVEWIAGEWGKYIVDLNQRASQSNCARTLSHAHH
ncbi:phage antirepressor KilAC domain-containing protein, partial [Paraburkholderia sp. SARCC-3016]|uniref:phage antirepressor KilAC domain-containing protein n=1 Tax=Paraburkholderia sp. SARCC-3016 TaxID=3058611 RepID=UPI002808D78F